MGLPSGPFFLVDWYLSHPLLPNPGNRATLRRRNNRSALKPLLPRNPRRLLRRPRAKSASPRTSLSRATLLGSTPASICSPASALRSPRRARSVTLIPKPIMPPTPFHTPLHTSSKSSLLTPPPSPL